MVIPIEGTLVGSTIATQHVMPTRAHSTSVTPVPTDMIDGESSMKDGGVPAAVFAGVGGMMVVIIALILIVILLIVIVLKKNRNHKVKDGSQKTNMYV